MKNYILIAATTLVIFTSCKNDAKQDEAVVHERDSLLSVISDRESSVNEFISSFNEVESNLNSVSTKQQLILANTYKPGEFKASQKERINAEIKAINELMVENSKKLKQLNSKLNKSDKKNEQLQKTIEVLNNQLNQKYFELTALNERLNDLNFQVTVLQTRIDTLLDENMAQNQSINDKTNELHTAYYIVGSSKDLQKSNLIDKEGGLLGIGRTTKVSNNLDNNLFTKIDYVETTSIPVNSKSMKIITSHPTDSYSLDKTGKMINSIMISDPAKFWSESKYLVITN